MKHVTVPATPATEVYNSDFNGTYFGDCGPHNTVKIECNYGSKYDGGSIELYFTDQELEIILNVIRKNLCQETKDDLLRNVHDNKELVEFLTKKRLI